MSLRDDCELNDRCDSPGDTMFAWEEAMAMTPVEREACFDDDICEALAIMCWFVKRGVSLAQLSEQIANDTGVYTGPETKPQYDRLVRLLYKP